VTVADEPDFDLEGIIATFLAETEEGLAGMEEALVRLEARPADEEILSTIFRVAHTLKGNAASLGFAAPAEFAHSLEDLLDRLRARTLPVTGALVTLLLQAVDALRVMVPEAARGVEGMRPGHKELSGRLAAWGTAAASEPGATAPAPAPGPSEERARTLRVDVGRLDRILNLSGEISIARGRLASLLERRTGPGREEDLDALRELDGLFQDLQEQITKVRMVPVGPMFRRFVRTVRDVAQGHGKRARLLVEGEDVEVDTTVIELIRDPLTHLVRNAIDHGIEDPEARRARGKDPTGQLVLRAFHDAGGIVIQLVDDGAGLNRDRILARARSLGRALDTERLSDADVHRLVFEPGFSTAHAVTDLSGRGIGMDVVRRNVEALRGSVAVESHEDQGTTVTIRLPLTLAIIRGFLVGVGEESYVIPLETVTECVDLPAAEAHADAASGVLELRGEAVPFVRLRRTLALPGTSRQRESVVVLRRDGEAAGLAVDELRGECEAVIKPLGRLFQGLPGIAGATILASGRVALILDTPALLKSAVQGVCA
jgi:two-component system chemotaxis sensor kinase CheA